MSNRREFIRSGALALGSIAASIALLGPEPTAAQRGDQSGFVPLYIAVFDDRFPESEAFAAQARLRGVRTESLNKGDVTRLWYDDLYHRWRKGPSAIAGLTTPDALFVIETVGNDAGVRLRFKAEHRLLGNRIEHRLYGTDAMLRSALPLETTGSRWGAHMGQMLSASRGAIAKGSETSLTTRLRTPAPGTRSMLVSWVLAPKAAAIISA